ncbi:MAG TPA: DUF4245 domain-containing protein [Jiangellaceae bacterium]|nr:DUF4245 domain-containing protein [Jiangellaceae bacterium]
MAGKPRGNETVGDAVRSLVVLLGLVAVIAIAFTVMRPDERLPDPVDYDGVLELVRDDYPYHVLAPASVPDGWRATSVDHSDDATGHRWRLGFLTADEDFVGLEQADGEIESYLADKLADFDADGTGTVDGQQWERRLETDDRNPDRALVHVADGVVTIVRGTGSYAELEEFASWLE